MEFYLGFFELLGDDLLMVVEEVRTTLRVLRSFNDTFIPLIPKVYYLETYDRFRPRPISVCNYLYKIILKVIVVRKKLLLSSFILVEKIVFLEERKIQKDIGTTQEGLHAIKISHSPVIVVKLDDQRPMAMFHGCIFNYC